MEPPNPALDWITSQAGPMVEMLKQWAAVNSGTDNLAGLARMRGLVAAELQSLDAVVTEVPVRPASDIGDDGAPFDWPIAPVLRAVRRSPQPGVRRVLLNIHADTVYPADHPFQTPVAQRPGVLNGPGVADAKGGLVVLLTALKAFERSPLAGRLAWEVLVNADEEIGSPGSVAVLKEAAGRNDIGLVFEPALPDGTLVGERKGSGNFTAVVRGRAAHAGRDFHHGRNAVHAAAALVCDLDEMNRIHTNGLTLNVGRIGGGGPTNVVPDLAIVRFNVRLPAHEAADKIDAEIARIVERVNRTEGISLELFGSFTAPPRPMDVPTTRLYQQLAGCGTDLGLTLTWHASGGVSDANKLAAAGLPVIDTLGPVGGNLHSVDEYVLTDSLVERAKLSTLLLMRIADGTIAV